MIVKLLTKQHLEFLSLKGDCTGSAESIHVKLLEISCHGSLMMFSAVNISDSNESCRFVHLLIYVTDFRIEFSELVIER